MSEEPSSQFDPFSPAVLEEATELRALARALELAKGFKLIFVRCNQADQRRSLVQKLRNELPSLNIQEIQFTGPLTHLLDELRARITRPAPDVVFVSGLEYSLPIAEEAPSTPLVANLNAARNSFPETVKCPLVLWVPEYILNAIGLGAPDFFSIRSGVYSFAAGPSETADLLQSLSGGSEAIAGSLSLKEKTERVKAIESLLEDYRSLPADKRDPEAEMRLRVRVAHLYIMLGYYEFAKNNFQRLLDQSQELGRLTYESVAYNGLGIIHKELGELPEAKAAFERALAISRRISHRYNEAMYLRNLGNVALDLHELEGARNSLQQSLDIIRDLGDRREEGAALLNLAIVSLEEGKLTEAKELAQKILQIFSETHDTAGERKALLLLGQVYSDEGRLLEAEKTYQQSLEIALDIGDAEGTWKTLRNLSLLHERQNDFGGAIDFEKQTIEVLRKIKSNKVGLAQSRLAILEAKAKEQVESQTQPA